MEKCWFYFPSVLTICFVNKADQACIDKIMLSVMLIYLLEIFDQFLLIRLFGTM